MSFFGKIFHRNRDEESDNLSIYKDNPSANRFTSFIFGFFALLVTLLVAAGLFFGARGIYRVLNGSSKENVATPQKKNDNNKSKDTANTTSSSDSKKQKSKNSSSTPSTGDNLPSTGDTLPNTGDSAQPQSLPKTGDPGM